MAIYQGLSNSPGIETQVLICGHSQFLGMLSAISATQWPSSVVVFSARTCTELCKCRDHQLILIPRADCSLLIFRSTPPGEQAKHERWSLVFFTRPGNSVVLRALTEDSPMIAAAVQKAGDPAKYETGATSLEWFSRRIKNQRINNRTVGRVSFRLV